MVTADRGRPEWERLVGYFLNQVVFRSRLSEEWAAEQLIQDTRDGMYRALEHQDFPYALMAERLTIFLRITNDKFRCRGFQHPFITNLAARLAIERRAVQHHHGVFTGSGFPSITTVAFAGSLSSFTVGHSAFVKNATPASVVTTVIAYSSRSTSTIRPPVVKGFATWEDTVRSWQLTQKRLSPMVEISVPFALCSNM